ncbi:TonB family protein [Mucilaginibacter ximonensis]|uniref:TonB family protein n=1 Tax=Mucilaginibacter ximonensis TaxID=538021 RepID=A0ABW5Y864_9SPHI
MISEPDQDSRLYNVQEFYKDKTPKLIGKSKTNKEITYEGLVKTFYPSGKKHELIDYLDGIKIGDSYEYYPNGKIYTHTKYIADKNNYNQLLLDCRDSTGNVLAADGEGKWRIYSGNFAFVFEEGPVKGGAKEGEWKGNNGDKSHNITFTEQYSNGELKSGSSVYADDNQTYTYNTRYVDAEFPGGLKALDRYVSDNGRYPSAERVSHSAGNVMLEFSVSTDGTITDCKVTESPNLAFSEEAKRLFKASPKWKPATAFGRPLTQIRKTPVTFGFSARNDYYITIGEIDKGNFVFHTY